MCVCVFCMCVGLWIPASMTMPLWLQQLQRTSLVSPQQSLLLLPPNVCYVPCSGSLTALSLTITRINFVAKVLVHDLQFFPSFSSICLLAAGH